MPLGRLGGCDGGAAVEGVWRESLKGSKPLALGLPGCPWLLNLPCRKELRGALPTAAGHCVVETMLLSTAWVKGHPGTSLVWLNSALGQNVKDMA